MIWKPVLGWLSFYEVSDQGKVRSIDRVLKYQDRCSHHYKSKLLSPSTDSTGRRSVVLSRPGFQRTRRISRLVLESFVGPQPSGMEGCHNDGDATNNNLSNLRWDTPSGNQLDRRSHNTSGGRPVRRGDGKEFVSLGAAADFTDGACYQNIYKVCRGKRKSTGGYTWEYIES